MNGDGIDTAREREEKTGGSDGAAHDFDYDHCFTAYPFYSLDIYCLSGMLSKAGQIN